MSPNQVDTDSENSTPENTHKENISNTFSRRRVLRVAGTAGAAGLGTTFIAGNSKAKTNKLEPSFNPSNRKETEKFVKDTFEVSRKLRKKRDNAAIKTKGEQLSKKLSEKQRQAIDEVFHDSEMVHDGYEKIENNLDRLPNDYKEDLASKSESSITPEDFKDFARYSYTIKCSVKTPVGTYDALSFTHKVIWLYTSSSVSGVEPSATGEGYSYLLVDWDYRGSTSDDVHYGGNHFISDKKGKYRNCVRYSFNTICDKDIAYSRLLGDTYGYGNLVDRRCP